jgi:hypothetical protein
MPNAIFQKYRSLARIKKIPKQKCQAIQGEELRKGKACKKEMLFVKYNNYMGFVFLSNGERMELAEMQLKAFERLINAALNGEIYVHGKDLLRYAGSVQWNIGKLFQARPNWHEFIDVTPRGFYRLKLYADEYKRQYEKCKLNVENRKHARDCL